MAEVQQVTDPHSCPQVRNQPDEIGNAMLPFPTYVSTSHGPVAFPVEESPAKQKKSERLISEVDQISRDASDPNRSPQYAGGLRGLIHHADWCCMWIRF
jgi:hypothetical protein